MSQRFERRDRLRIYSEIVRIIADEVRHEGQAKITRVQTRVNVPYVRFKEYLDDLIALGLVEMAESIRLTGKGEEFLREYTRMLDFYRRIGLME
jgi:predicted transcriptional regulator